MGYSTDFEGGWGISPTLKPEHRAYLAKFSDTRRMMRDATITCKRSDPVRKAVGLPAGYQGEFYVGEGGDFGQGAGGAFSSSQIEDVVDHNKPPETQPGLWCKWEPNEDGTALEWSGAEKFYKYVQWLKYLITNFLTPWGYTLKGKVTWQGESDDDVGFIVVYNNQVFVNEDPVLDKLVAEL